MISTVAVLAFDDLPPPSPATTIALLGLLACLWLAVRVQVLRRREARRAPDEGEVRAPRWLQRLAAAPATNLLLALAAAGFLALLLA